MTLRLQSEYASRVVDFCGFFQHLDLIQHFLPALGPADGFFPVEGFQLGDDLLLMLDLPLLV